MRSEPKPISEIVGMVSENIMLIEAIKIIDTALVSSGNKSAKAIFDSDIKPILRRVYSEQKKRSLREERSRNRRQKRY